MSFIAKSEGGEISCILCTALAPDKLREYLDNALREGGMTVLHVHEHSFKPQGYTVLFLLAESHAALHTFPEFKRVYVHIYSCKGIQYAERALALFIQKTGARVVEKSSQEISLNVTKKW